MVWRLVGARLQDSFSSYVAGTTMAISKETVAERLGEAVRSRRRRSIEQESRVGNRLETKKIAAAKFGEFSWILSH